MTHPTKEQAEALLGEIEIKAEEYGHHITTEKDCAILRSYIAALEADISRKNAALKCLIEEAKWVQPFLDKELTQHEKPVEYLHLVPDSLAIATHQAQAALTTPEKGASK